MTERLPDDVATAIEAAASRLGGFANLRFAPEVTSTNDLALMLATAGASTGTAVLADCQTAGRGRRGRTWFSPPGAGLYLSVVIRPAGSGSTVPLVTLAAGVAAAHAILAATGLQVELKWPNDLVVGRPWRKLGGILCEASGAGGAIDGVVVGIGLNLLPTAFPIDVAGRATSLEGELGRAVDRGVVVTELLAALRFWTERLWAGQAAAVRDAWRTLARPGLAGAPVRWQDQRGDRHGAARDIDDNGALLVESDAGIERLVGGEVIWERLSRE